MKKLLFAALLLFSVLNAEEEFVFKAKGDLARELKELLEKHADEGTIEIEKVEKDEESGFIKESKGVLDVLFGGGETKGDIKYGKELYQSRCAKCHGVRAEKSKYGNARNLNTLSKEELIERLEWYHRATEQGSTTRFIMEEQVIGMSTEKFASIVAYIHSLNEDAPIVKEQEIKTKKSNQGSYLK